MAPTNDNERPNPNDKVLHVWSKPIEEGDQVPGLQGSDKNPDGTPKSQSAFSEAVSMIKKEDFTNVANTPCARQGLLTGIGAGAGFGGLKFVIQASYEFCQYQRRAEKIQMKRHIEVVTQNKKEQARKLAEERRERQRIEEERKARNRAWYKFW
ncbi:hypothetical protein ACHAQJ_001720 [Trichoderma viride]